MSIRKLNYEGDLVQDLEQALEDARLNPPEGGSGFVEARVLSARLGLGRNALSALLRKLHDQGRLEVSRAMVPRIDGQLTGVPVYRLKADDSSQVE